MALRLVKYESLLNTTHTHNAEDVFLDTSTFTRNLNNTIQTVQMLASVVDGLNTNLSTIIKTVAVNAGDTSVTVPFNYTIGTGLLVFRNGVFQNINIEYDEVDSSTVSVTMPCTIGEVFTFILNENSENTDNSYTFVQSVASNVWHILHNLNTFPVLVVLDANNNEISSGTYATTYNDDNTVTLTFTTTICGTCVCYGKLVGNDFTYINYVASNVWNIQHNLNKYPVVKIFDENNVEVIGTVNYVDLNNITLSFNLDIVGKCICK
jgi:hypothetical protein